MLCKNSLIISSCAKIIAIKSSIWVIIKISHILPQYIYVHLKSVKISIRNVNPTTREDMAGAEHICNQLSHLHTHATQVKFTSHQTHKQASWVKPLTLAGLELYTTVRVWQVCQEEICQPLTTWCCMNTIVNFFPFLYNKRWFLYPIYLINIIAYLKYRSLEFYAAIQNLS